MVTAVAFRPYSGSIIASGDIDGTVKLWDTWTGRPLRTLTVSSRGGVTSLAFSSDGQTLAVGAANGVSLWRVSDGQLLQTLKPDSTGDLFSGFAQVVFRPYEGTIAAIREDGAIYLWRPSDGSLLATLTMGDVFGGAIAYSPDGQTLAAGAGRLVKIWRAYDLQLLRTLSASGPTVTSLAFSPDGQLLAAGSTGGGVDLWRTSDWQLVRTVDAAFRDAILAFCPYGDTFAVAGGDTKLSLRRVSDGALLETYTEETGTGIASLAFSPDGTLLAYGRDDAVVAVARMPKWVYSTPVRGDVDGDGAVTIQDASMALRFAVGVETPSARELEAADADGDGAVEIGDVVRVLCAALGITPL